MKLKNLSSVAFGTIFFAGGAIAIPTPGHTGIPKSSLVSKYNYKLAQSTSNTAAIEASVFQQINQYRASVGLPALTRNSAIDNQARTHSQNMADGAVPFGHNGFQQRIQAIAIPNNASAENVAYNQGSSNPANQAVQSWLNSSGHLANIKGNYNLTGIGVASNSQGKIYFTQIFLRSK